MVTDSISSAATSLHSCSAAVIGDSEVAYAVVVLKNVRGAQPERQSPYTHGLRARHHCAEQLSPARA